VYVLTCLHDTLFSNTDRTKENDIGDGIFDIFDRYNFTVKEDEPLEKDVAIDPELLGKAYEKFNAIRPDNFDEFTKSLKGSSKSKENKFNKKFGVYYTPREIVHYMCQQGLINYLTSELSDIISKEEIESLISVGEHVSENEATVLFKEKLIEEGRQKTTKNKFALPERVRKYAKIIDDKLSEITVCDPAVGSGAFPVGMMNEIVRIRNVLTVFINEKNRKSYHFKRRCIEYSLYGVDIDPGAVEIAKLRLWLSLIVDEDDIKNIKPLPNLDYKIVCGNSLLEVEKNIFNSQYFNDLENIKPSYFNETNPAKKLEYKKRIDSLISKITNAHEEFDFEVYFSEIFHKNKGFDIIIANPPYVRVDDLDKYIKTLYKTYYESATGKYDLYYLFFEKSIKITNPKGVCVFISPNKYCAADSAQKLREILFQTMQSGEIISASRIRVFSEASNYPIISIYNKNIVANNYFFVRQVEELPKLSNVYASSKHYSAPHTDFKLLPSCVIPINVGQHTINLLLQLYSKKRYLSEIMSISEGLRIPEKLELNLPSDFKIAKQYQFTRYSKINIGSYLSQKGLNQVITENSSRYYKIFTSKIIIAEDALKICATLDLDNFVPQGGVYFATSKCNNLSIKFLLGLINSRLLSYLYESLYGGMHMGGGYLRYRSKFLENLPLPEKIDASSLKSTEYCVDKILDITKYDDCIENPTKQNQLREYEKQINHLVYKLYDLTPEEIKVIENHE